MSTVLAQVGLGGYSLAQIAIIIVVVAAVIAMVWVALRQFGIAIPQWVIQIFWIILVAFVVILGIKFVAGML